MPRDITNALKRRRARGMAAARPILKAAMRKLGADMRADIQRMAERLATVAEYDAPTKH